MLQRCLEIFVFCGLLIAGASFSSARSFDDFSSWPTDLKINGTVIACSNGKIDRRISRIFRSSAGRDRAKLVVIAFDPISEEQPFESMTKRIEDQRQFEFSKQDKNQLAEIRQAIADATSVVLFSEEPLDQEKSKFFDELASSLKTAIEKGFVVCAIGPVSSQLGRFHCETSDDKLVLREKIGLIPDSVIHTNYTDTTNRSQLLNALAKQPLTVGIGIPQHTGIVLQGRTIRVYGDENATFALVENERQSPRIQHVREGRRQDDLYQTTIDLTAWRRDAIERALPAFPPTETPIPCVKNGTLIMIGGGYLPEGIMQQMVAMAGGKHAKLVYIPCTDQEEVSRDHWIVDEWKEMGVESAVVLHTKDRHQANSDETFLAPLKEATGIFFGGGRQWNLADSYYGTQAHRLMKDVLRRGGVIAGSSAGASIQADYLARANPIGNLDIMAPGYERGLGFIGGVAIDQHFSQRDRQKDMTQLVDRYPQLLGIGIDETTALIVKNSIGEVVGEGKVFFYDRERPIVHGKPDYISLNAGSKFDLAERKQIDSELLKD